MASTEGGVEIEKVAHAKRLKKILKAVIDPLVGAQPYQGREIAFKLGLVGEQVKQFTHIFLSLAKLFKENDLALVEVNPLVITKDGNLHCLDAKINVDGNALFRQRKFVPCMIPVRKIRVKRMRPSGNSTMGAGW